MANIPPPRKSGFIRVAFFEGSVGSCWIYDIPINKLPPLEKYMLDNYLILDCKKYYMPRCISGIYGVGSHIYIRFQKYLVWEQFLENNDILSEDDLDKIFESSDYLLADEVVACTLAGDSDPSPENLARLVILIHLALYFKETKSLEIPLEIVKFIWKMPISDRLLKRFSVDGSFEDVTLEIGICLQLLLQMLF